jgi:eukaryotic-like serine/threonine-protein kinase
MQNTATVLKLFSDGRLLTAEEFGRFQELWEERKLYGDEITNWLTRTGVFSPAAARTVDLMAKGFIREPDAAMLFSTDGLEKLKTSLLAPKPVPVPALVTAGSAPAAQRPKPAPRPMLDPPPAPPPSPYTRSTRAEIQSTNPTPRFQSDAVHKHATPSRGGSSGSLSGVRLGSASHTVGVGSTLGKCLLTGVLGQGGHGMVYSALHQSLNIPVAIKVLLGEVEELHPEMVRQLRREAQLLARLNHPNVIRVLDFDLQPVPHVVLEYAEGPSLADLIAQTGGLWVPRAADIFMQVARGLAAAWELKVVHRDIKPANILMARNGVAKIADLGLALTPMSGSRLIETRQVVGTCAYMAPEQARTAHEVDFRADMYSLGATFYHCVTGHLPFQAKSAREFLLKHAAEELMPPHVVAPDRVDEATSEIICTMMAKNADDRYQNYDDLISALMVLPSHRSQNTLRLTPNGGSAGSRTAIE